MECGCVIGLGEKEWNKVTNNLFLLKAINNSVWMFVIQVECAAPTHSLLFRFIIITKSTNLIEWAREIQLKFASSDSKPIQYALVKIPDKTISIITAMPIIDKKALINFMFIWRAAYNFFFSSLGPALASGFWERASSFLCSSSFC